MNGQAWFVLIMSLLIVVATVRVLARDGFAGLPFALPRLPQRQQTSATPVNKPATSAASPATDVAGPASLHLLPYAKWHALTESVPHILVHGETGSGKTVMAQALAADRPGKLLIIDPNWEPKSWGGLPVITTGDDDDFAPIDTTLTALLGEMSQRASAFKRGEKSEPLTILWDEVPECAERCPAAGEVLRRLARRARKYQMRLIILTQSTRVKALGLEGQGDALDNFCWLTLGDAARDLAQGLIGRKLASPELVSDFMKLPHPALIEYRGKHKAIETDGLLALAERPIAPVRCWVLPQSDCKDVAGIAGGVSGVAITQNASDEALRNDIATGIAHEKTALPEAVAQVNWSMIARLFKAGVLTSQTKTLAGLGFPAGNGADYLAAREALQKALAEQ